MRYQRLEDIRGHAVVAEARPPLTRRQRLRRWAQVLRQEGERRLEPLRWVEFYDEPERRLLRREGSPLALAFADPVLRADGLAGDTLGEAQLYFELSDEQAHKLLCDCHFHGEMTGRTAARRVGALARPAPFAQLAQAFW